jgi:AcrR family transcriptional regulator
MTTDVLAGDSRAAILDAATQLFAMQGLEATSIKSIGHEAGVNPALIYYYFDDKSALYGAVLARMVAAFPARLAGVVEAAESPAAGLAAVIQMQAEVFLSQPLLPRLIARELADHGAAHGKPLVRDNARRLLAGITALIRAGQAAGEFRDDLEPEFLAVSVLSQVNWFFIAGPVVELVLDREGATSDPTAVRRFADHVVRFSLAALEPSREG